MRHDSVQTLSDRCLSVRGAQSKLPMGAGGAFPAWFTSNSQVPGVNVYAVSS